MTELVNVGGATVTQGAIPLDATPENCPLKPSRGHVVIVRELPPHMRRNVIVPEHIKKAGRALMAEAVVLAVGQPELHFSGKLLDPPCTVGDRVLTGGVSRYPGHMKEGSETIYEVLPFEAIISLVDKDSVAGIPDYRGFKEQG